MGNKTTIGTFSTRMLLLVCLGLLVTILIPQNAEASHFRYGTISWSTTDTPGQVEFRMKMALRYNAYNAPVGNIIGIGTFNFGDNTSVFIQATVTNVNISENWLEAEFVVQKTYNSAGPFTAGLISCCRIAGINNASNGNFWLTTTVTPFSGNSSPVSNQFPIVNVGQGSASSFFVSSADPDGDDVRFRLATPSESGINTAIPNLSIDPNTGQVTWNNTGLNDTQFWALQVIVEDLDENENVKSRVPVDFMLQIVQVQSDPPVCEVSPTGPFNTTIGNSVSFDVTATADDPGFGVSLNGIGLPSGSSTSPSVPVTGTGTATSQFSWTPSSSQTGSFVLTFSATDQYGQQTQCGATINVSANQPPIADAGEDQTVTCPACDVELDGSGSSDPDGDSLTYTWTGDFGTVAGVNPTVELPLGEHTITLTVDDGEGETDSDEVVITVVNTEPVADAGADQTLECPACDIVLDGSGSFDADGHELTYTWSYEDVTLTGVNQTIDLPLGVHTITLTVEDECEATHTDEVTITVVDTTPPELVTDSEPFILWPPNHKYHTFDILDFIQSVEDACDENVSAGDVIITRVTSDEPEEQSGSNNGKGRKGGGGDGNTTNDIIISEDGLSVDLRAERLGGGNGRVYTVYVGVSDGSGNIAESSFQVHVPKSKKSGAIDDGLVNGYEVTGFTPEPPSGVIIVASNVNPPTASASNIDLGAGLSSNELDGSEASTLPDSFSLFQNYPNPFNPNTIIRYHVPTNVHVKLEVFDIAGRLISTLVNESKSRGEHEVIFDASNLNSGLYLYRISAENYVEMHRMTLIK